jgi:hypothetical protein
LLIFCFLNFFVKVKCFGMDLIGGFFNGIFQLPESSDGGRRRAVTAGTAGDGEVRPRGLQ